jgi:hypothetical protein
VTSPIELVPVGDDVTAAAARKLIGEYLSWVAGVAAEHHGLVFDTQAMLASDIGDCSKFYAPHGRFYLLRDAQAFIGVGALQRIDATTGEIQRMVVQPPRRARAIGCDVVRLESPKSLAPAHALYRSAGFVEVPPHDDNRMPRCKDEAALYAYRECGVHGAAPALGRLKGRFAPWAQASSPPLRRVEVFHESNTPGVVPPAPLATLVASGFCVFRFWHVAKNLPCLRRRVRRENTLGPRGHFWGRRHREKGEHHG